MVVTERIAECPQCKANAYEQITSGGSYALMCDRCGYLDAQLGEDHEQDSHVRIAWPGRAV